MFSPECLVGAPNDTCPAVNSTTLVLPSLLVIRIVAGLKT